jgi:hypothetical protein
MATAARVVVVVDGRGADVVVVDGAGALVVVVVAGALDVVVAGGAVVVLVAGALDEVVEDAGATVVVVVASASDGDAARKAAEPPREANVAMAAIPRTRRVRLMQMDSARRPPELSGSYRSFPRNVGFVRFARLKISHGGGLEIVTRPSPGEHGPFALEIASGWVICRAPTTQAQERSA